MGKGGRNSRDEEKRENDYVLTRNIFVAIRCISLTFYSVCLSLSLSLWDFHFHLEKFLAKSSPFFSCCLRRMELKVHTRNRGKNYCLSLKFLVVFHFNKQQHDHYSWQREILFVRWNTDTNQPTKQQHTKKTNNLKETGNFFSPSSYINISCVCLTAIVWEQTTANTDKTNDSGRFKKRKSEREGCTHDHIGIECLD